MSRARKKRAARRRGGNSGPELTFADLVRALDGRSPDFAELVCRYVEQPDPAQNRPEEPSDKEFPELPEDAWTIERLRMSIAGHNMWGKTDDEAWATRRGAWKGLMAAAYPPPRLKLGDMMIELYDADDAWSRRALLDIFGAAKLGWGLWKGFKGVYKRAEQRHDAEMLGVLACRCDILQQTRTTSEISAGTAIYMRRRAWRYLRQLGQAMPELFPQFACQVLRHYPRGQNFYGTWVATQIWARTEMIGETSGWFDGPPAKLSSRAFDEAWKLSADPLLRLIEDAHSDTVCKFAIRSLKEDFAPRLRALEPAWLARVAGKSLPTVDEFIVELLEGNPDFHQSKLAGLGLVDTVVGLLRSDSDKAVRYAIEYCNAQAPVIAVDELLDLAGRGRKDLSEFVVARVEKMSAAELGVLRLVRMLGIALLKDLGEKKLKSGFSPDDIDESTYVALATGDSAQQKFVAAFYADAKKKVPTAYLRAHAEQRSLARRALRAVMTELGKRSAAEIGTEWIKAGLFDTRFSSFISEWLSSGMLKGDDLDVEWLKGLVARPSWRRLALTVLGNTELVAPHRIGSRWLLRAARHSDTSVAEFAHNYLLHHFSPGDFALEQGSDDPAVGVQLIFALLDDEAPVRRFAASYLTLHHPDISGTLEDGRARGIKPRLTSADYPLSRLRPLLFSGRADVRVFAAAIARAELLRWNKPAIAYDMASSLHREPRVVGAEAVLGIGEPQGQGTLAPPVSWLDDDRAFAMAESSIKATREIALTLIRKHYGAIGSAAKLAWLMDSPDREVRLFAVRLLWDRHRPRIGPLPAGREEENERFESEVTLREFFRTVLFGLPPGRMERRDGDGAAEKPYPASVAKRRVIEVVRDMGLEDEGFAGIIAPVLEEFLASRAKGEWHGCVAALAQLRAAHPGLKTSLPQSQPSAPSAPSTP